MRQSLYDYCIETRRIDLLHQWDTDENLPLTPKNVTSGSARNIHWLCDRGHQWEATPYARTARNHGCPICAGKKLIPGVNDLQTVLPDIAREWNVEKNGELKPCDVFPNTHCKVWWKCGSCGHEWQAAVKSRAGAEKCGCPVCANRRIEQGVNDLESTYPNIAKQWHPTKNGALTPRDVTPGKRCKVWWSCEHGHEWETTIQSRVRGSGCPVCTGKTVVPRENDLTSAYPQLAKEWHPSKNNLLTPDSVTPQSNRIIWWQCSLGHEWKAPVSSRVTGSSGCPYCSNKKVLAGFNDLATLQPKIAAQWHPELNGTLTPEMVTCGSSKKVWWRCAEGHEWKAVVYSRAGSQRCGCPECAGRVNRSRRKRYDEILSDAKLTR